MANLHLYLFILGGVEGGQAELKRMPQIVMLYEECCWNILKYFKAERFLFFKTLKDCRLLLLTIYSIKFF